jgi:hypothetical protein
MKIVDRVFGWLLVLGGILHSVGAVAALKATPGALVWPLAGSVAAFLLAALNLMRVNRPGDRTLAWVSAAGSIAWFGVAMGFGASVGNFLDPRGLYHAIVAAVLAGFSIRTAVGRSVA